MRDFWDFNDDGELDFWEESMKCATILKILDDTEEKEEKYRDISYSSSNVSTFILNTFKSILFILVILMLFGACAAG